MTSTYGCSWPLCALLPWTKCVCGYRLAGRTRRFLVGIITAELCGVLVVFIWRFE
jgi:hypothetical protein